MGRSEKMAEIKLGRVLKAGQIVGQLLNVEDLLPWEPFQIGIHGHRSIPSMACPREREQNLAGMIEP